MNISELLQTLKNDASTMSIGEKLLGGLATALLAMGVVFVILVLIALIIRVINTPPKLQIETELHNGEKFEEIKEDTEVDNTVLTAIITAAIVASGNKNIVVRRITRTNNTKSNWEKVTNV